MDVDKAVGCTLLRRWGRRILSIAIGTLMLACSGYYGEQALKLEHVQFFNVRQTQPGELRISGIAVHSSLSVQRIESVLGGREIQVRVVLVPAKKGLSGSFAYVAVLNDTVEKVTFGDEHTLIWTRERGAIGR